MLLCIYIILEMSVNDDLNTCEQFYALQNFVHNIIARGVFSMRESFAQSAVILPTVFL